MNMRTVQADFSKNLADLEWLHLHCFPSDAMPDWGAGSWWITWEDKKPIAFVGVEPVESWPGSVYISRVGVVQQHRGKGLQAFLISRVEKAAKGLYDRIITTTYENPHSANNFIRRGFKTYMPQTMWGAPGTIYWIKEIT